MSNFFSKLRMGSSINNIERFCNVMSDITNDHPRRVREETFSTNIASYKTWGPLVEKAQRIRKRDNKFAAAAAAALQATTTTTIATVSSGELLLQRLAQTLKTIRIMTESVDKDYKIHVRTEDMARKLILDQFDMMEYKINADDELVKEAVEIWKEKALYRNDLAALKNQIHCMKMCYAEYKRSFVILAFRVFAIIFFCVGFVLLWRIAVLYPKFEAALLLLG